jgi:hypothetical protein
MAGMGASEKSMNDELSCTYQWLKASSKQIKTGKRKRCSICEFIIRFTKMLQETRVMLRPPGLGRTIPSHTLGPALLWVCTVRTPHGLSLFTYFSAVVLAWGWGQPGRGLGA